MKVKEIAINPYVRVHHTGMIRWGYFEFNPFMARLLATKLWAAANRADPLNQSRPPWEKPKKET
jgi:hypothetical protein